LTVPTTPLLLAVVRARRFDPLLGARDDRVLFRVAVGLRVDVFFAGDVFRLALVPERFVLLREVFAAISNPLFRSKPLALAYPNAPATTQWGHTHPGKRTTFACSGSS
jgi:hypothetical protein